MPRIILCSFLALAAATGVAADQAVAPALPGPRAAQADVAGGGASPAKSAPAKITLGEQETIVIYGDSITEQSLYSALLETFFVSRFPHRKIATFNFGWGGDTASGGHKRFARDVAPEAPTLVFVNFGMNDGGYKAFDEAVYQRYLESQDQLADDIAAIGAREVLFTASPVDDVLRGDGGVYNETLAKLAAGLIDFAGRRHIPVIDLYGPMLEIQREAKAKNPDFTMIPDTIHPNLVGHLVMTYLALRQIEAPHTIGEIVVGEERVQGSDGAQISNVEVKEGDVVFDLDLPFLPFYVPPEARPALDLVPFERELNRFVLRVPDAAGDKPWAVSADGITLGTFRSDELAQGIDLAVLEKAPWTVAGRLLWQAAQYRWTKHQEAWRLMGIERPAMMLPDLPTFEPFMKAQRAHADAMGHALQSLAQPGHYRVRVSLQGAPIPVSSVLLSPTYPFQGDFDHAWPPETDPEDVAWRPAPFVDGHIDLGGQFTQSTDVVAYARMDLEADSPCALDLSMGSDDGLAVFANGKRLFAHDVMRSLRRGEDEVEVPLQKGRNVLLFKVTQAGGGWELAVEARARGKAKVWPSTDQK